MSPVKELIVALAVTAADTFQLSTSVAELSGRLSDDDLTRITLDETEVENRGSHCLDGSVPQFHFGEGTDEGKFLFWLNGGGYCVSESDCASYLPIHEVAETMEREPIQKHDTFKNYNHVHITTCDLGIYMGDRSEPVVYNGHKLYFQGARIIKHIVDTLQKNYTMKEVLVVGGSGGGHSLFSVADYFKGLMPASVTKFAVAPINGWYVSDQADLYSTFTTHNMQAIASPACTQAFSATERYKCIDPATAYRYTETNMFMTQILDYTFQWNVTEEVTSAYKACLSTEDGSGGKCDSDSASLLQDYLSNYTTLLSTYPKYSENGQGGYVSTCTKHTFYSEDDLFNSYANNGVKLGDAISKWWLSLGTSPAAVWYLPCHLGSAPNPQCESSCASSR